MSNYNDMPMSSMSAYSNLANYNGSGAMAPVPAGTVVGVTVVPAYGGMSVNTFGSNLNGSGYKMINGAYGNNASNCDQKYVTMNCNACSGGN